MILTIEIYNYVDSINVLVDEVIIEKRSLSLFSKAKYICDLEPGVHAVKIVKQFVENGIQWKKYVAYEWLSCLSGSPNWTIREVLLNSQNNSIIFKTNVCNDMVVRLRLSSNGFEIIKNDKNIFDVAYKNVVNSNAQKRVKKVFITPVRIICYAFEMCFAVLFILCFIKGLIFQSVLMFLLNFFWICFLNLYLK